MKSFCIAAALSAAAISAVSPASAQTFPTKPIRVVVPFSAGGTDTLVRTITDQMGSSIGQSLVIDNKPGANTIIGADAVAKAPADGYTLLATLDMTMTMLPAANLQPLPYNTEKSFVPVSLMAHMPVLLVANNKVPAKDLKELITYGKANPGKLNFGWAVISGLITGQQLKTSTGVSYTFIPYKGGAQQMTALLAGEIDLLAVDLATAVPFIKDGKVRALATTSSKRNAQIPDVATMGEQGFPELERRSWYALFAPAGTPRPVIDKLNAEAVKAIARPDVRKRLEALGYDVESSTPDELGERWKTDAAKWAKVIKDANIKLE